MLAAVAVAACAVCAAGDPTLRPAGAESSYAGRLRAFVDLRVGGVRAADDEVADRRAELGLTWSPSDAVSLAAAVPGLDRTIATDALPGGRVRRTSLGDVEARATFALASSSRTRLALVVAAKAPTAPVESDARGELLPAVLQPGCSAIVPALGAIWSWRSGPWSADASAALALPFAVRDDAPHAGDSLRVGANVQLQPSSSPVAPRLGVAARLDGGGERRPDVADPDSGGAVAYLAPGFVVSPARDLVVSATAYAPALQAFAGRHREATTFALALAYDF